MRSLVAVLMVVVAVPTFAQSYGNTGFHSGAYGNAGDHVGAYGNYGGGGGNGYMNSGYGYNTGGYNNGGQAFYGNANGNRYSPYQAENGDYRNYDNDYDGRREPTHVRGHYHSRNGYTRGHYRALPYR